VLVLSGQRDPYTTAEDTHALYAAANDGKKQLWLVPGAGHVDLYGAAGRDYEDRLLAFIKEGVR
jgi:fermentation-respiration switch protein FrsA (DUF1100 family)